jgi:ABC-type polysaccharide/polyol phosphate transport system ATPase subunit
VSSIIPDPAATEPSAPVDVVNGTDPDTANQPFIRTRDVVVEYPLGALMRMTLKSEVFRILQARPKNIGVRQLDGSSGSVVRALNGITVDIAAGERVALVGLNGAGKSTLLRAMAGVYQPVGGHIEVGGRIHALFNTSTGFEPSATGRDNIFFRGLVMGLTPDEISAKVEEIVEFAELGAFIDLPINTYSSGMGVRLAFAISAYLRGDVLLIDEIFGAGDITFQAKAQARMEQLMSDAKILVFASHSSGLLRQFCQRALWLHQGELIMDGTVDDVLAAYSERYIGSSGQLRQGSTDPTQPISKR